MKIILLSAALAAFDSLASGLGTKVPYRIFPPFRITPLHSANNVLLYI